MTAEAILSLTYGELMYISEELADAIREKDAWPKFGTALDFATVNVSWSLTLT